MSTLGLRPWEKLLFHLTVILLAIGVLQVILILLLSPIGILPPSFAGLSAPTITVLLLSTAGVMVLALVLKPKLTKRESMVRQDSQAFSGMIPLKVTRECVLLPSGQGFAALGFVSLPIEWDKTQGKKVLQTLSRFEMPVVLVLARTLGDNVHTHLVLRSVDKIAEQAVHTTMSTCHALHQALTNQGVAAERVTDELGVEQLYWTCVLGKDIHEDVLLQGEETLVVARVGGAKDRLLVAADLLHSALPQANQGTQPVGLFSLLNLPRPLFLAVALKPVAPEVVARQLQKRVMEAPELSLLVEAVGEAAAIQLLRNEEAPTITELAALLAGRAEGLWQCNVRLICQLTDTPILTEAMGLPANLLEPKGLAATATAQPHRSGLLLPTSTLFRVLGPQTRHQRIKEKAGGSAKGG
ncbi:MAG: hypothetical protein ACFFCO_04440 [Promethearchaeota archaeon]